MNVALISDTHDNLDALGRALAAFRERGAGLIVHAGDFVAPFAVKKLQTAGLPVVAVFGNCDGERQVISELLPDIVAGARHEEIAGRRFVIVHSLDWLAEGEADGADVVVCGHTHVPGVSGEKPRVVNPGECCGWVNGRSTVAVLDTETLETEIIELLP